MWTDKRNYDSLRSILIFESAYVICLKLINSNFALYVQALVKYV